MDTAFNQKVDSFIAANKENILRDIAALVAIPSVSDETKAAPGAPFGAEVRRALDTALAMAEGMGLVTQSCEGYMGCADLPGKSEKQIAAIAHLDVVPAGNGWTGNPFTMTEKDGFMIGRGTADDKGPAVLALYMAKFFKEQGEELPYTLRILLGCSEETGMEDLHYYLAHYPQPAFCFTPDAEFPVCNGEKGGFNAYFESAPLSGNVVDICGGIVVNAVPDAASALVKGNVAALAGTANVTVSEENGMVRLTAHGKGGHAAMPEGTVNAIGELVRYLLANNLCTAAEKQYFELLAVLHADTYGKALGVDSADGIFTPLTCVGGVIKMENGVIRQSIDIRYPTSTTGEALEQKLGAVAAQYGSRLANAESKKPFYISADSDTIKTLIDTYNEVTGKNETPFTMGGGTYARYFDNAVSFGPEVVDMVLPEGVGPMHGANEGSSIALLLEALKIYIIATARLMQLPL